ncbi:uracil-DNA glycosylase family domain protein [compost metagenome]
MELVQPRAYIALGGTAARSLLGRPVAVMKERGQWVEEAATGRRVLVTLHPSALLRGDPLQREAAWEAWLKDLSMASELMKKAGARRPAEKQPAAKKPAARPAASHARRRVRMVME